MIGVLIATLSTASGLERELEICLQIQKPFPDAVVGDWWTDNSTNAPARGFKVFVTDDWVSRDIWLDDDTGCTTLDVEVSLPYQTVLVQALSKAKVNGIEIQSHLPDTSDTGNLNSPSEYTLRWENQDVEVVQWGGVQALTDPTSKTLVLPQRSIWSHLGVTTMAFRRSDFNLTSGPVRGCCTDDQAAGYDPDGTCNSPDYTPVPLPLRIFHGLDVRDIGVHCGRSRVKDDAGFRHPALGLPVEFTCQKTITAHELGHVIVEMRAGNRTDENDKLVPAGGCEGDINSMGQVPDRGNFTKELMSTALREGWANFVSMFTWNRRTENDCTEWASTLVDFDLDGTIDNDAPNNDYDGVFDCHGTPFVNSDVPSPMDSTNWLQDLQDTGYVDHCDRELDDDVEANRATVYDVSKLFRQLNHQNGHHVPVADLADLYVDMCPRQWAMNDTEANASGPYVDDDLPLERLKISAAEHGLTTELNAVLPNVEH